MGTDKEGKSDSIESWINTLLVWVFLWDLLKKNVTYNNPGLILYWHQFSIWSWHKKNKKNIKG